MPGITPGASVSQVDPVSSSAKDDQDLAAESERTRIFLFLQMSRDTGFSMAEDARCTVEEARNSEFRQLLNDKNLFWKNRSAREALFTEQEAMQDRLFEEAEGSRNRAFAEAQAKREEMFQSSKQDRLRMAKSYSEKRDEVRTKGRTKRNEEFEALVRDIKRQFDDFLKSEVELLVQRRREVTLDTEVRNTCTMAS